MSVSEPSTSSPTPFKSKHKPKPWLETPPGTKIVGILRAAQGYAAVHRRCKENEELNEVIDGIDGLLKPTMEHNGNKRGGESEVTGRKCEEQSGGTDAKAKETNEKELEESETEV